LTKATARQRTPTRKRGEEVVDAAARVFAERGYHGASTRDISELLGMRQASIYYYFGSKEEALEEVCAIGTAGFIERAEAIVNQEIKPYQKLVMLLEAHTLPLADRSDYIMTFLNERKWLPTESRRRIGRMTRRYEAFYEKVLRDGVRSGCFHADLNPKVTAIALLGILNSIALWHQRAGVDLQHIIAVVTKLATEGIGASASIESSDL